MTSEQDSPTMDVDPDPSQDVNRKTRSKGKSKRKSSKPAIRANVRAGLQISSSRVKGILKRAHRGGRINKLAPILLTAAAEEFAKLIFESTIHLLGKDTLPALDPNAGESEKKRHAKLSRRRINPQILNNAIRTDEDISAFMDRHKAVVLGGGVLPIATRNMDRAKNIRKRIKSIRLQGLQALAHIREQGKGNQPEKSKKKKSQKSKSKK